MLTRHSFYGFDVGKGAGISKLRTRRGRRHILFHWPVVVAFDADSDQPRHRENHPTQAAPVTSSWHTAPLIQICLSLVSWSRFLPRDIHLSLFSLPQADIPLLRTYFQRAI